MFNVGDLVSFIYRCQDSYSDKKIESGYGFIHSIHFDNSPGPLYRIIAQDGYCKNIRLSSDPVNNVCSIKFIDRIKFFFKTKL